MTKLPPHRRHRCSVCNDCGIVIRQTIEGNATRVYVDRELGQDVQDYRPGVSRDGGFYDEKTDTYVEQSPNVFGVGPLMRIELCECVRRRL